MNQDFPGLPDYTGPTFGWFTFIHHSEPIEYSHNINKRLSYIDSNKPEHERATRRRCLRLVPTSRIPTACLEAERVLVAARLAYNQSLRLLPHALQAHCNAWLNFLLSGQDFVAIRHAHRSQLISLALELVPDAPWDGNKLVFNDEPPAPTGDHR